MADADVHTDLVPCGMDLPAWWSEAYGFDGPDGDWYAERNLRPLFSVPLGCWSSDGIRAIDVRYNRTTWWPELPGSARYWLMYVIGWHLLDGPAHSDTCRTPEGTCDGSCARWDEVAWVKRMAALEDERGPFPPNGAVGGVVARARRERSNG